MRILIIAIAMLVSILPLAAGSQEDGDAGGIYIALGDSVAAGAGSSLPRERSYPSLVGQFMEASLDGPVIVENIAEPGTTARSLLDEGQFDRFVETLDDAALAGLDVLAVTLTVGGNEVLEQIGTSDEEREAALQEFSTSLESLAAEITARIDDDTPIVVTTIYDPTGTPAETELTEAWWIARFNTVIRDVAGNHGFIVADIAGELGARAESLTRYPTDVHPTNAGHREIARIVWSALGFDQSPPVIEITSPETARRLTPTLRFTISEAVPEDGITINSGDNLFVHPVTRLSEREFIALIEITDPLAGAATLEISAADMAGNIGTADQTISLEASPGT